MLSTRTLESAIFNTELNDLCRKYLIKGPIEPSQKEILSFPDKYNNMRSSLFESFIVNKEVNFKVEGENIPLSILLNEIGLRGIEELIDDGALSFTLWSPLALYTVDNLEGLNPLCSGRRNQGVFADPEESITTGLAFMRSPLRKGDARMLTRKLRDTYISVPKGIEHDCVSITMSALESGKLDELGLSIKEKGKYQLNEKEKKLLVNCASDLMGYKYLITKHATASPTSNIKALLNNSLQKAKKLSNCDITSEIIHLENIPDIRASFVRMGLPMDEIIRFRKNKHAKKFRKWLSTLHDISDPLDAKKYYLESIQSPKGFFETFLGKSTKSVSMMILGSYAGSLIDAHLGPIIGGAVGMKVAEPITNYALDMADDYLFSEITKGWTPKVFIEEFKSLSYKYSV
ncbi:hypothetical protein [Erwinia billingiae]|uniref:hypothetical protein n=1 Tax=Erwinia billingiae TaxID=182337 RepID=UPI001244E639|nr:hypothetical protein [Erwinia billingiae]